MPAYDPPFQITNDIASLLIEVSELLGRWSAATAEAGLSPQLRRSNRIKTIQASLAIEQNTLTIEQVTAIMDGKTVLGLPREILEVQNAIKVYETLNELIATSESGLLAAHGTLLQGLADDAGRFRAKGVGIYNGDALVHMPPPADRVSGLMHDLLAWLKQTDLHPLIASCVFHYEFEFIHPFSDGNGRMGRLWQTLILSQWNPLMAYLPIETLVKDKQTDYYAVLKKADGAANSTVFIEFMLAVIRDALLENSSSEGSDVHNVQILDDGLSDGLSGGLNDDLNFRSDHGNTLAKKLSKIEQCIIQQITQDPYITGEGLMIKCDVSIRTIERALKSLRENKRIQRVGSRKTGHWILLDATR